MLKSGALVAVPLRLACTLAIGSASPCFASVATSGCGAPDVCTLAELVRGGRIDVNDQRFERFEIERQTHAIDFEQVHVSGLDADSSQAGLFFASGGEWRVLAGSFLELRIGYRVRSLVPGTSATGAVLDLVVPQTIEGGSLFVDQTHYDAKGGRLGGAVVELDSTFETSRPSDSSAWSGRTEVVAEAELFLSADGPADETDLGGVEVRYALPEHTTAAGLLVGFALIGLLSRRDVLHSNSRRA